jgi:ELWxxDGT repeat protein
VPRDNPILFFDADDGIRLSRGRRRHRAGTVLVKDINPGPSSSNSGRAFQVNGTFLFDADDGIHGRELWRTDGSGEGTLLAKDIRPGADGSYPSRLVPVGATLYFAATDGISGPELWKSDGSEGGTVLVKDILEGPEDAYFESLTRVDGTLFFTAETFTDGTTTGRISGGATAQKRAPSWSRTSTRRRLGAHQPDRGRRHLVLLDGDTSLGNELWRTTAPREEPSGAGPGARPVFRFTVGSRSQGAASSSRPTTSCSAARRPGRRAASWPIVPTAPCRT